MGILNVWVQPKKACQRGFTLMEMLVTMVIFGIIASIAVPRYQTFVVQRDVNAATADVAQGFEHARVFAQSQRTNARFCPIDAANLNAALPPCVPLATVDTPFTAWVVLEVDAAGTATQVLARSEPLPASVVLSTNRPLQSQYIQFGELGSALSAVGGSTNGTVAVAPRVASNDIITQTIVVGSSGVVRSSL